LIEVLKTGIYISNAFECSGGTAK